MQLDDYFEFLHPDDIRIKGHRIGIDNVLYYYLEGYTPEEMAAQFPTLNIEQIYATITYYLHNRAEVTEYLTRLERNREQRYQESLAAPSSLAARLREVKAQRQREMLVV